MKKYRLICHVNHIRYKDIYAKNIEQAQEMLENIEDYNSWEYGKEYGESYVEEKEIDVQSNTKEQIQREEDRSKRSNKSDV